MEKSLSDSDSFANILSGIEAGLRSVSNSIESVLYSSESIHILAIILTAIILVSFFCVFAFVVMKCLLTTSKYRQTPPSSPEEEQKLLESELQNELEQNDCETSLSEDDAAIFQSKKSAYDENIEDDVLEQELAETLNNKEKKPLIELDWKKDKILKAHQDGFTSGLQAQYLKKDRQSLIGMIVNMIGRRIDDLKIAQALNFRSKEDLSEESALQLVSAIKDFLRLCANHEFDEVRKIKQLPSEEDCILSLISGDNSYAMALIEALMDEKIKQSLKTSSTLEKRALFRQASSLACDFGTLAEINDPNLAAASFELALELNPENTLAWSRCADIYTTIGMQEKANTAYQNVLKIAHQKRDIPQQANACKFLSQYYYALGDTNQASQLYAQSKNFYDSIGINRPLDRKEIEIIEILDKTPSENIIKSIMKPNQNHL